MTVPLWSAALTPKGTSMAKFYTLQWISERVVIFSLSHPPPPPLPFLLSFSPRPPKRNMRPGKCNFEVYP